MEVGAGVDGVAGRGPDALAGTCTGAEPGAAPAADTAPDPGRGGNDRCNEPLGCCGQMQKALLLMTTQRVPTSIPSLQVARDAQGQATARGRTREGSFCQLPLPQLYTAVLFLDVFHEVLHFPSAGIRVVSIPSKKKRKKLEETRLT